MKEFRQTIPSGMEARVENGEVIYTPIEECPFEVGDIYVSKDGDCLRLFEGVDDDGCAIRRGSYSKKNNKFFFSEHAIACGKANTYTKATPEQESLFNHKCLENGVWFDQSNNKWIKLKEGNIYNIESWIGVLVSSNINGYVSLNNSFRNNMYSLEVNISSLCVHDISEPSSEMLFNYFDRLKEEVRQLNECNNYVEDIRWKPKKEDEYWYVSNSFEPIETKYNNCAHDTHLISVGNCFKTKEETLKAIEYIKECWKNYKP
ncbi:MAG: hypothetical protein ACRCX5_14540 [Bacteroidales bacterium]